MRILLTLHLVALLLVSFTQAATHVNISIGHQAATNPADVTYVNGQAPAELRAGPTVSSSKHHSDFGYVDNGRDDVGFDRLRSGGGAAGGSSSNFQYSQSQSARLTADNNADGARMAAGQRQQQYQQNHQRQHHQSAQDKQNQEFERYIQSYHSGPTVETVFESATPSSSQRQTSYSSSSSVSSSSSGFAAGSGSGSGSDGSSSKSERIVAISSRPAQVHSFERQVALPTAAPTNALLPPADDHQSHTIVNHQPQPAVAVSSSSSSSSSSSGYDQNSFEPAGGNSYNSKTNYNGYDDNDLQHQYPPVVDDSSSQGDFNSYSGGHDQSSHGFFAGSTPAPGYLPSYPRPVVTKTIQIAQPALKAKKYEIRHPAIQKEFYDIEERVVIKPAGTIVVELERPVAKIPKGETILPLGHPHPAVASAYNNNGASVVQTMDSSDSNTNYHKNQYTPSPVYNPKSGTAGEPQHLQTPVISSTTIASTLTTTPTYEDSAAKDEFVEANLNKQFNGDAQFVTTTERSYSDDNDSGFYATTTESSNRNYNNNQFYGRDETDRPRSNSVGHVEIRNNGAPGVSTSFVNNNRQSGFAVSGQASYGAGSRAQYQPNNNYNDNNNNNNQYKAEFLSNEFYNKPKAPKPARLQEAPRQFSAPAAQIIKHEHNIHLPASQHNIFLGRLEKEEPQQQSARLTNGGGRYNEEAAHVLELKPYLKHHPSAVIVYASNNKRPAAAVATAAPAYNNQHSYDAVRYAQNAPNNGRSYQRVQYSAPYSQMRHHPDQSARYSYGSEYSYSAPYAQMRHNPEQSARYAYSSESSYSAPYRHQPDQSARYSYGSEYSSNAPYAQMRHNPEQSARYVYGSEYSYNSRPAAKYVNDNSNNNDGYQSMSTSSESSSQPHAHIQIKIPHHPHEADKPIVVSSTISPAVQSVKEERTARYRQPAASSAVYYEDSSSSSGSQPAYERSGNLVSYKSSYDGDAEQYRQADYKQPKSLRIVESSSNGIGVESSSSSSGTAQVAHSSVDVNLKSSSGHIPTAPGSRVIAATPAPTDAAASSESFHKRRIVVNHPFQTVREVVEHEPITNYHHVQVNEPASPEFYHHTAPYYQQETHGAIRQAEVLPLVYHRSATTHGNLHYAPVVPIVHGVTLGYHHHG